MAIGQIYREIVASERITDRDVEKLEADIRADGLVDNVEAEILFRIAMACKPETDNWTPFYVDALTDYYVWHQDPRGFISETQGEHLLDHIVWDDRIRTTADLELLINIVYWAGWCPVELVHTVLRTVWDSVLHPAEALYGRSRIPNVIGDIDVEILRMAIYAPSVDGGLIISEDEAELLFELNNATIDSANHPSWRELFVMAVANYLMFPDAPSSKPTEADLKRREAWLTKRRGVASLIRQAGGADNEPAGMFASDVAGERDWRQEALLRVTQSREIIAEPQALWLAGKIEGDGVLHRNEKALLEFIRKNSLHAPPPLLQLFEKVGV